MFEAATLHAICVHFPIALFVVAFIFQIFREHLKIRSSTIFLCLTIGAKFAVLAALFGYLASLAYAGSLLLTTHLYGGVAVALISLVCVFLYYKNKRHSARVLITGGLVVLTTMVAFLGGEIVRPHFIDNSPTIGDIDDESLVIFDVFGKNGCFECHIGDDAKGDFKLVDAGRARLYWFDKEKVLERITLPAIADEAMPPDGPRVSQEDIQKIRDYDQRLYLHPQDGSLTLQIK